MSVRVAFRGGTYHIDQSKVGVGSAVMLLTGPLGEPLGVTSLEGNWQANVQTVGIMQNFFAQLAAEGLFVAKGHVFSWTGDRWRSRGSVRGFA